MPISDGAPNGFTLAPGYVPADLIANDITIVYTTDGSDPATSGIEPTGIFDVMPPTPTGSLKVLARHSAEGYLDSDVVTIDYERYTAPVVSDPEPGAFTDPSALVLVELTSADTEATIQYRIGGPEVWSNAHYDTAWVDYTAPFHLFPGGFVRLETRAVRAGWKSWTVGAKGWSVATDFLGVPGVVYRAGSNVYVLDADDTDPQVAGFDVVPASATFFNGMIVYVDSSGTEIRVLDENGADDPLPNVNTPSGKQVFRVVGVDTYPSPRTTLFYGVESSLGGGREWLRYIPHEVDATWSTDVPTDARSVSGIHGRDPVYVSFDGNSVYWVDGSPLYEFPVDDLRKPVGDIVWLSKTVDAVLVWELWYVTSGGAVRTPGPASGTGADDDAVVNGFDRTIDEISGRW